MEDIKRLKKNMKIDWIKCIKNAKSGVLHGTSDFEIHFSENGRMNSTNI